MSVDTDPSDRSAEQTQDYEQIPDELKERDQWLLFDRDHSTPRQPHWDGDFGKDSEFSWSDPECWNGFEAAVETAQKKDSWGIGFVVAKDNDDYPRGLYGCIDLDGCLRSDGTPKEWLPDISKFVESGYVEYSASYDEPGDTGLHIPIVGQNAPEWWSNSHFSDDEHEGVEYLTNKFIAFTGVQYPDSSDTVTDVNPAQFLFESYKTINGETPSLSTTGNEESEYNGGEWLDKSAVKDALGEINPDISHSDWIRLAYAVHDFDNSSSGKSIFEKWSKQGQKYDENAERQINAVWDNGTAGSDVTVATLVHMAKSEGWEPPTPEPQTPDSKGGDTTSTELADAIDSGWFDPEAKVVRVNPTADYSSAEIAKQFRNPDDLPTDVTLSVYEADGGREFLENPDSWTIEQSGAQDYSIFAEWSVQEMKRQAIEAVPTERFAWVPEREEWFWCDDAGIWHQHGDENLRQWLDSYFGPHYRTHLFNEVRDQLKARTRTKEQQFGGGPDGWIATESGLVNLEAGTVRPIQPSDKVRWTLGTQYDPNADCPKWKQFVGDVAEPSDIQMLQEFVGYCLHHWELPYKKALIIFGPTDAGKSVFLDVIQALFAGDESPATSSTSIQYLANERWGPARLVNTAVNIRNDLSAETIQNAGKVKELIAGDNLDAERKRKPVFKFAPTAKHLFAANRAPDRSTDDEAFWNRWLTVVFPESIPRQYQDEHLTDELLEELPGILNWAIEGHKRLMSNGRFTNEPLPYQNRDKWERYGNSIEQWFSEYTEQEPDAVTPKWTTDAGTLGAYDSYKAFARSNGLEVETDQTFTAELKQREGISKRKLTIDGTRAQSYRGFRLTDDAPEPEHDKGEEEPTDPKQSGLNV